MHYLQVDKKFVAQLMSEEYLQLLTLKLKNKVYKLNVNEHHTS